MKVYILLSALFAIILGQTYNPGSNDRIIFYTNPTEDFKTDTPKLHKGLLYYAGQSLNQDKQIHVYNGSAGEYLHMVNVTELLTTSYTLTTPTPTPTPSPYQSLTVKLIPTPHDTNRTVITNPSDQEMSLNAEGSQKFSRQVGDLTPTPTLISPVTSTPNSDLEVVQTTINFEDLIILFYPRIGGSSNQLIAYNPSSKKVVWSYENEGGMFGPSEVYENGLFYVLIAEVGVQELLAMKAETGEIVWKLRNDEKKPLCQYSSNGKEICVTGALRDESGQKVDVSGDWGVYKQPSYLNGTLFVNLNSVIVALDADEGLPVKWVQDFSDDYSVQRYSPLVYDDMVYTITLREYSCNKTFNGWPYWTCSEAPYQFFALSASTGEVMWSRDFNIFDEGSYFWFNWFEIGHHVVYNPIDDMLYVSVKYYMHKPSPFFSLYAVKPSDGTDIWSIKLDTNSDMSYRSLWDDYQNALLFYKDRQLYHIDTSLGMVRAIDAKVGNQVWQVPTNIRYSAGLIGSTNLYLSQQHISESVVSAKDNYILGVSLSSQETNSLGVCDWVQDKALMEINGVTLYHRQCENNHGNNNNGNVTHPKHHKSNQLLEVFLGVVISTTVAVLF